MTRPTTENVNAETLFKRAIKGKNVLTPDVIEYLKNDKYAVELSTGFDMEDKPIFGVTVVSYEGNSDEYKDDLSALFWKRSQAKNYIKNLFNGLINEH